MYNNAAELLAQAEARREPLYRVILENEMRLLECDEEEIRKRISVRYEVMRRSAQGGDGQDRNTTLISGMTEKLRMYAKKRDGTCGDVNARVVWRAVSCLEVNASMGKICAAPTAGACGILPAVMITVAEEMGAEQSHIENGLIAAGGIGAIVMQNATVSGAEAGCQAECGVAAAMAAGAAVCLRQGTNGQMLTAASLALMSAMGLVCDPVGGYVQIPCVFRNATQALSAIGCADMALAGVKAVIPFDEVVQAMAEVGEQLPPTLRETAEGGVAATPTGQKLAEEIRNSYTR